MSVPSLRVRQRDPRHEPRQIAICAWPEQQMPVAGHQAVRQQAHVETETRLLQNPLEGFVVLLLVKQSRPLVAAVENVVDNAAQSFAG